MRTRLIPLAALLCVSCSPTGSRVEEPPTNVATRVATQELVMRPGSQEPAASTAGSTASGGHVDDHDGHDHPEVERQPVPGEKILPPEAPELTPEQVAQKVATDLPSLGSMSLGKPNAGALVNGVQFPEGERWEIVQAQRAYGTQETIDYLITAIDAVHEQFPGAHKLSIGHLSKPEGGRIYPHRSHQSGRDIDIGYYYVPERAEWYRPANKHTLDVERSWALVKAFVVHTDVEMMFIDRSVQRLLKEHALAIGEDPSWLNTIFEYKSRHPEPIVRHTWGHKTHIHVRFYNPKAQQLGVVAYDALVKNKLIRPRHYLVPYQARGRDTLASLAKKAGTSAATIQKVNGIGALAPGQTLYVPMRGNVAHVKQIVIPPRRLPPVASGERPVVAAASE